MWALPSAFKAGEFQNFPLVLKEPWERTTINALVLQIREAKIRGGKSVQTLWAVELGYECLALKPGQGEGWTVKNEGEAGHRVMAPINTFWLAMGEEAGVGPVEGG